MIEYTLVADAMVFQDETIGRLKKLALNAAYDIADEKGAVLDTRFPATYRVAGPFKAYNEDGEYIGDHITLTVSLTEDMGDDDS